MFNLLQHLFTTRALEQENLSLKAELSECNATVKQRDRTIEELRQINSQHEREKNDLAQKLKACLEQKDEEGPLEPEFT